jgi:hypothetical protein
VAVRVGEQQKLKINIVSMNINILLRRKMKICRTN